MSASLNNSIKYSSTTKALTQILYSFRTREVLNLLRLNDPNTTITPAKVNTNEVDNITPKVNIKTINVYPITRSTNNATTRLVTIDEYRPIYIDTKD